MTYPPNFENQQGQPPQQPPPYYPPQPPPLGPSRQLPVGLSVAGMVTGIVGLVFEWVPILGLTLGGLLVLVPLDPQEQRDPHDGREQDELLADRVEAAIVEDDRVDDVRRVTLRYRPVLQDDPVRSAVVAELRHPANSPREERSDPERADREHEEPRTRLHLRRSLILARVSRIITG